MCIRINASPRSVHLLRLGAPAMARLERQLVKTKLYASSSQDLEWAIELLKDGKALTGRTILRTADWIAHSEFVTHEMKASHKPTFNSFRNILPALVVNVPSLLFAHRMHCRLWLLPFDK